MSMLHFQKECATTRSQAKSVAVPNEEGETRDNSVTRSPKNSPSPQLHCFPFTSTVPCSLRQLSVFSPLCLDGSQPIRPYESLIAQLLVILSSPPDKRTHRVTHAWTNKDTHVIMLTDFHFFFCSG